MTTDLLNYVNVFQGTDTCQQFSNGNTNPIVAMPWGMTHWTLQTREELGIWSWQFQYGDRKCQGIRATHQASPWLMDYGNFTVMPVVGEVNATADLRSSSFKYDDLVMRPDYLSIFLLRYRIQLEMTSTERCSHLKIRFPDHCEDPRVLLQSVLGPSEMAFGDDGLSVWGAVRGFGEDKAERVTIADDFRCYFYVRVNQKLTKQQVLKGQERLQASEVGGEQAGLELIFEKGTHRVEIAIGTSFVSVEQARLNLAHEIGDDSFEKTRQNCQEVWNQYLSRVELYEADELKKRTFYSALYRSLLFPRVAHERNEDGEWIHYSPYTNTLETGRLSTANGFWDTFRTVYPMLALIYPDVLGGIIDGWVSAAKEGGFFPKWASPGYCACMIGTHIDAVIADAMSKGIKGFNYADAYRYVLKNGMETGPEHRLWGRLGLAYMREKGYVPSDKIPHATARTLEFSYNDFCVSRCAAIMGDDENETRFREYAQSYRNVFDPEHGLMRGRRDDGSWEPNFSPTEWSEAFCEAASIQYSYMVPHDVEGLMALMGGKEAFVKSIEDMLAMDPVFEVGQFPCEVHEMSEMAAVDFGQYAHCNQPSHHILFLFALAGRPDLTNYWVHRVLKELYRPEPDGLPGDEDNGEMSAWYVLASLGIFSVCPGTSQMVLSQPLFEKARITVPGHYELDIECDAPERKGEHKVFVDGTEYSEPTIESHVLTSGVTVKHMTTKVNSGEKTP